MAYNQRRTSASNVILLPLRLVRSAATSLRSPTASRAGTPTPRHPPQRRHLSLPLLSTLSNPQPQRRGIWKITGVLFAPFRRTSAGAISNSSDVNEDEIGDDLLLEDEASDKTKHKEFLEKRHGKKINLDKRKYSNVRKCILTYRIQRCHRYRLQTSQSPIYPRPCPVHC